MTLEQVQSFVKEHWRIDSKATCLSSEWGGTYRIDTGNGSYLLKIAPPSHVSDSRVALEIAVARHLEKYLKEIKAQCILPSVHGEEIVHSPFGLARLYNWINGKLWAETRPHDPTLLENLGESLGHLVKSMQGFDHSGAHEEFTWGIESNEWKKHFHLLPIEVRSICQACVDRYELTSKPRLAGLRHGVNYHDANDYNIIVSDTHPAHINAFIDYGDCHYAPVINDLAICLAYALMDQPDVLGASRVITRGFHRSFPLLPEELEVVYELTCMRLVLSLIYAAKRHQLDPSNAYWQVSNAPAEKLLRTLTALHPHLMLCYLRSACGFEPSPHHEALCQWLKGQRFSPVLGLDLSKEQVTVFDWSVASTSLGSLQDLEDVARQTFETFHRLEQEGNRIGIGRYDEPRPIYTTSEYQVPGLHAPSMRTIHLGIDLIMPAGTAIYAPLDGKVVTLINNAGNKEYGPLVILEHKTSTGLPFYTLYGHNNIYTLSLLRKGRGVKAGEKIGEIGPYPENGNWVPHLHFQIITHLFDYTDDYPGVASPEVRDVWLSLCPDPNLMLGIVHPELKYHYTNVDGLQRKRKKILGPNLSLSYQQPLHIVRGWKSYLYDEYGRTYLDTVNNIAHVGHEHPDVIRAGQQQAAVLNTNTRYLHRNILTLAQQLLETLPGHLEVVWFVNSGSEANELALRMARKFTGRNDTLVLEDGYHGNTQACIDVSHYKFKHLKKQEWVRVVPVEVYRGEVANFAKVRTRSKEGEVENFAKGREGEVANFNKVVTRSKEGEVANFAEGNDEVVNFAQVFIHESLPSCAGQLVPHEDFFMDMYAIVKRNGGVCIADEVQTGLGRVGSHYWAFELFTIAPDIVTIGKPLGNGHPIAAVACTREIAEAFAKGPEFFSSFGGNPVSCAIGSSVVDVIEKEGLQAHALESGEGWMKSLKEMQLKYPVIGDVRGHGLFIGVEFVDTAHHPSKRNAEYVQRRMLDHRILTSLDGPHGNVMKIKPPMCITEEEVGWFMEVMEKVLQEDALQS